MLSVSENIRWNIDNNVEDMGKLFDGEMDGDCEFTQEKESKDSKLAPMHNSYSS